MEKATTLIIALITLISCNQKTEYKTITVKDKYTIEVPKFLSKTKSLNADASLQCQNLSKVLFVIVIDEAKTDFPNSEEIDLNAYTSIVKGGLESSLQESAFSPVKDTLINDLKVKLFSVSGKVSGISLYYEMAHIESDKNFYQILTWTDPKRKDTHKEEMKKMVTSFNEIKNSK